MSIYSGEDKLKIKQIINMREKMSGNINIKDKDKEDKNLYQL